MNEITANHFRENLKSEVDKVIREHRALHVKRRNGEDFVVLGADDWRAIEETIYLNQIQGLVDSIHEAAREPLENGTPLEKLKW
ncbi:MAG: type II toxin-antitoxin system Phd/YefM family antitoxin [Gammaproteobacteria bacterium]|nr:type II toxin-antitoxin system Phd/YefM family antitoxin [Gammaproteobacteria bacterium]